jgi:hypothetical protein
MLISVGDVIVEDVFHFMNDFVEPTIIVAIDMDAPCILTILWP